MKVFQACFCTRYSQSSWATSLFTSTPLTIYRNGYVIGYDTRTKNPRWVYERLTLANFSHKKRRGTQFKEDPRIPELFRATKKDYQHSGFDRGHLASAASHTNIGEALSETFFLSNVSPQVPAFNRGYWKTLEKHVRVLAQRHGIVEVVTGPLFLSEQNPKDGKRYVTYQVIGDNEVAVPTHFFKAIQYNSSTDAYILPNKCIPSTTPLGQFKSTIQKIEKASGIKFSQINDSL